MSNQKREEEQERLHRLSQGSQEALLELYDQYWEKIYQIVRRKTGYPEFAQDIAQDVFILVWDKREDFKDVQYFNAYLATIAKNLALRHIKRAAAENTAQREFIYRHGRNLPDTSLDDIVLERQYNDLVKHAVNDLTPRQKQIYALSKGEHLSHEEIADRLNLTQNAVKKHMANALVYIRRRIKNHIVYLLPASLSFFL